MDSMKEETWGTWEELVLAFAVNRYGTTCWESVCLEIQKRCNTLSFVTPLNCMLRFNHLKHRYKKHHSHHPPPWLDDLRNQRIAELKSQLEHYDLSILSLQLKVKRLKQEGEESFRACDEKLDKLSLIEKEVGGNVQNLDELIPETNVSAIRTESCNGSSDSISKETVVKIQAEVGVNDLLELVAESKKLGEIESEDVTSRLNKEENEKKVQFGNCAGAARESQSFLEILQSYKLGMVSDRLLDNQETSNYRNLIRQHIDIKSVYKNFGGGYYSDSEHKFFRDLLLLVNNAILFFENNSSESNAATELRHHILEKMAQSNSKADLSAGQQTLPTLLLSKQAQEPSDSLRLKSQIEGITRVSRKRSSFAARSSISSSSGSDRKSMQKAAAEAKQKQVVESEQTNKSSVPKKSRQITKRRSTDGSALNSESSKKNSKYLAKTTCDEDPVVIISNQKQAKLGSLTDPLQSKGEKNLASTDMARGAANFLDRLNQSSPPNNEPLIDAWENQGEGGKSQHKGSRGRKCGSRKDKVTKRSCEVNLQNEESSLTRRQLGRPPKRAAAPTPVLAGSGKCSRAIGDIDADVPKQSKKRSRK